VAGRRARGARRRLARSQHFLRSRELAADLVRAACIATDDYVVDLGAGTGRLTAELARRARCVLAVELDPSLAARLRGRWANVEVVEGDAAAVDLPEEPFRVVANLPFDRTNDLLRRLLDDPATPLTRADLIVAWGVALKRGVPWPSTFNDVVWGALYSVSIERRLPRIAFDPPPRVDAGVLVFRRRPTPLVPADAMPLYRAFVARGFRHGLDRVVSGRRMGGIAERGAAARDLDAYQWAELFLRERRATRPRRRRAGTRSARAPSRRRARRP
jgi:23S rRNA (adenine-N6)-dimethyltransferase